MQLLAQLLMRLAPQLPAAMAAQAADAAQGMRVLALLPPPLQQRCSHLVHQPQLVVESLVLSQQVSVRVVLFVLEPCGKLTRPTTFPATHA